MTATYQVPASESPAEAPASDQNNNTPSPANNVSQIPEGFPDKFVKDGKPDYEALARSYSELEKRFSQINSQPQQAPQPSQQEVQNRVQAAGIDFAGLDQEFAQNGKLSEASYEKLAKAGFDRAFVDSYIAGQLALQEQAVNAAMEKAGGKEVVTKALKWAGTNLSPHEIEAYNRALEQAPPDSLGFIVQGLVHRYQAAVGQEPNLVRGQAGSGAGGYRSMAEVVRAMRDPRYRKDPAYRADVEARLAVSKF